MSTDQKLADLLLNARQTGQIAHFPPPEDEAQAYRIQALVMPHLGAIGGWKVGAASPDAAPSCAPMPANGLVRDGHQFDSTEFTQREVESEICFRLAHDLPPRPAPYTRADIIDAIAACHPGIEILQSRLANPAEASPLALLADFIQTGAYAVGDPIPDWQDLHFPAVTVTQRITGGPFRQARGNPAGDMIRLIQFLANQGAVWAGGVRAGQIVTCGSWTGKTAAPAGSTVTTAFGCGEAVSVGFTAL